MGVPAHVSVTPVVVGSVVCVMSSTAPVPPIAELGSEATKKGVGNTMARVGLAPGVPAAVTVNCMLWESPSGADTPLPAAPDVPQPVEGVTFVAMSVAPVTDVEP